MLSYLRLIIRLPLIIMGVFLTLIVMIVVSLVASKPVRQIMMMLAFKLGAFLFGLRVVMQGTLSASRPLLLVSNHFSYLDIIAIGSSLPVSFTPKSEIGNWPVIGSICKMSGCLFIDRRPSQTLHNKELLEEAITRGEIISLFPEGTTNEGKGLLPFKSSYFSLAESGAIAVQPLSVVYTKLNGKKVDDAALPIIGWYGDMTFLPALITFLRQCHADVTLVFHPVVTGEQFASRKALAAYGQQQVESGLNAG